MTTFSIEAFLDAITGDYRSKTPFGDISYYPYLICRPAIRRYFGGKTPKEITLTASRSPFKGSHKFVYSFEQDRDYDTILIITCSPLFVSKGDWTNLHYTLQELIVRNFHNNLVPKAGTKHQLYISICPLSTPTPDVPSTNPTAPECPVPNA